MGIFKEVTKTVKNIFNADDDMMFDDDVEFQDQSSQQGSFSFPKPFGKKANNENVFAQNKQGFDLGNHGFEMAKNNQNQKARSNGKIQVYVPKSFEEAFGIIKNVKSGFTAMVNVEVANPQVAQRIVDVISGAIFALDGDCKKMGEKQYIFSLNTETIGAYDFLPTSGMPNGNQGTGGFNFNVNQGFDFNNQNQMPNFAQGNQFQQNPNFGQQNNFSQPYNFGQNAEKLSQDLQGFYQPPKSQF